MLTALKAILLIRQTFSSFTKDYIRDERLLAYAGRLSYTPNASPTWSELCGSIALDNLTMVIMLKLPNSKQFDIMLNCNSEIHQTIFVVSAKGNTMHSTVPL